MDFHVLVKLVSQVIHVLLTSMTANLIPVNMEHVLYVNYIINHVDIDWSTYIGRSRFIYL